MFNLIVISLFILFFILLTVIKDRLVLQKIAKGSLTVFTGVYEALAGKFRLEQLGIQIGIGVLFITLGGVPPLHSFAQEVAVKRLEK